jgi:hypothetical protein
MHEYDLYIPLCSNNGQRIPASRIEGLRKTLIKRFGGLTQFPQKQQGFWKLGKATFRDNIVIWRVLSSEPATKAQTFWNTIKGDIAREWRQAEVLVVRKPAKVI